jgi:hypothetical protein
LSEDIVPKYRVRLFLSADLSGSTAFKNKQKNPIDWVPKFQDFYSTFLSIFAAKYDAFCGAHIDMCEDFRADIPKLWKTVGDEVIFVNRVASCAQVIAYVHAFNEAMDAYSAKLRSDETTRELDVKGNGWLASFPYPNQTISLRDQGAEFITENMERDADDNPHNYEFLGSGIDSGFRIAKNATPSFFTVSPSLALILCMPPHNEDTLGKLGEFKLVFNGVNSLKGVIDGEDYPIVGIDTERDEARVKLNQKISALSGVGVIDQTDLKKYLLEFEKFHSVSSPALKLDGNNGDVEGPAFYTDTFLPSWQEEYQKTQSSNEQIDESSKSSEGDTATQQDFDAITAELPDKPS